MLSFEFPTSDLVPTPVLELVPRQLPLVTAQASAASSLTPIGTPYADQIQKAYLAFFLRPADTAGFNYYAAGMNVSGGDLSAMTQGFGASPEYLQAYAGYSTPARINAIYTNLFNRPAEQAGLDYWGARLDSGTFSINNIAISILMGAQNSDAAVVANRVAAAKAFTTLFDPSTSGLQAPSLNPMALAKSALANVTADSSTVTTSLTAIAQTMRTAAAPGATVQPAGGTFQSGIGGDVITLSNTSRTDKLTFSAQSTAGRLDSVFGFNNDKIDLSGFGVSDKTLVFREIPSVGVWGISNWDYFVGKSVVVWHGPDKTQIYIDVDRNGNLDWQVDAQINVMGVRLTANDILM